MYLLRNVVLIVEQEKLAFEMFFVLFNNYLPCSFNS